MFRDWYFLGLDLGQAQDPTAIAVLESAEVMGEWNRVAMVRPKKRALRVRYLERVALGTAYPEIVERVARMTRSGDLKDRCDVVVDATGVGRPVVDLLRPALACGLMPVMVTGGESETQDNNGYYRVPKRDLIVGLQLLLQQGRLQIAAGLADADILAREMAEMRVRVTGGGREQFGVWREGEHDDLVFAVALGAWAAGRSDVKCQMSKVKGQKSKVKSQKSKVKGMGIE